MVIQGQEVQSIRFSVIIGLLVPAATGAAGCVSMFCLQKS